MLLSEPFDPPQNVTFANVTASSVTLLWHPPTEPNGIITYYTIFYSYDNNVTEQVRLILYIEYTDRLQFRDALIKIFVAKIIM